MILQANYNFLIFQILALIYTIGKREKLKKYVYYFEGMKFCSCRYNLHVNNSQIKLLVQDDQRRNVIIGFTNLVETLSLPILFYFLLSNITQDSRSK